MVEDEENVLSVRGRRIDLGKVTNQTLKALLLKRRELLQFNFHNEYKEGFRWPEYSEHNKYSEHYSDYSAYSDQSPHAQYSDFGGPPD